MESENPDDANPEDKKKQEKRDDGSGLTNKNLFSKCLNLLLRNSTPGEKDQT